MVPCVAPGFCGSFGSCVPGGSWWLRGFLAFWLLAACLLASLVHGSSGSSGFFGSYGSCVNFSLLWLLRLHIYTYVYVYIYISINQSIKLLSIYLFVFSMYLTLSYSILPYLTLSFPILPYLILSFPFYSIFPILRMNVSWPCDALQGGVAAPCFFYLNPTWVLHEYWAYLYTLSRLTRGIE